MIRQIWHRFRTFYTRAYEAGQWSRYREKSQDYSLPDYRIQRSAVQMRADARSLDENYDLITSVLNELANKVVGDGIRVIPLIKDRAGNVIPDLNREIKRLWSEWSEFPETTQQMNRCEMESQIALAWFRDGEILARHIETPTYPYRTPIAYAVEIIDADFLPMDYTDPAKGISQGIEIDGWRRPRAYHFIRGDALDSFASLTSRVLAGSTRRTSADDVMHLAYRRRFNQLRGVTALHAIINRAQDTSGYEEYERIAAKTASSFTGVMTTPPGLGIKTDHRDKRRTMKMAPGFIKQAPVGTDVKIIDTNRPNTALPDFLRHNIRMMAAGTNGTVTGISKDYTQTNYSSTRTEIVESRNPFNRLRKTFISTITRPIYQRWLSSAVLNGQISLAGVDLSTLFAAEFRGPGVGWVDRKAEIESDILLIENRLMTREQVILDRGGDPDEVDAILAQNPPRQTQGVDNAQR